jgi:hypothetical protein
MKLNSSTTPKISRRSLALGGAGTLAASTLGIAGVLAKQATPSGEPEELGRGLKASPYLWTATSPATHKGDTYTLVVKNTSTVVQKIVVRTVIMDHHAKHNTPVIRQEIILEPGAEETLTATNDYGDANHFATRILSETNAGLEIQVTLSDVTGAETATFNQGAFWVRDRQDLRRELRGELRDRRQTRRMRRRLRRHGLR